MTTSIKTIEELFLKIFKIAVLIFMGLALLAIPVLLAIAVHQWFQAPQEPAPAQKAPVKEIRLEDLKNYLIEKEKREGTTDTTPKQQAGRPVSLRFQEEATVLFRCSNEFARQVGAIIDETNDVVNAQKLQELRGRIEWMANGSPLRGAPWVTAVVSFGCAALADPSIIALRKENKVKQVFYPLLEFHAHAWAAIQQERVNFEQREANRVAGEIAAEEARVLASRIVAKVCLTVAGGAFTIFMLLALYLLAAKAENDLREINASIQAAAAQRSA